VGPANQRWQGKKVSLAGSGGRSPGFAYREGRERRPKVDSEGERLHFSGEYIVYHRHDTTRTDGRTDGKAALSWRRLVPLASWFAGGKGETRREERALPRRRRSRCDSTLTSWRRDWRRPIVAVVANGVAVVAGVVSIAWPVFVPSWFSCAKAKFCSPGRKKVPHEFAKTI